MKFIGQRAAQQLLGITEQELLSLVASGRLGATRKGQGGGFVLDQARVEQYRRERDAQHADVRRAVVAYWHEHGYGPSIRDLAGRLAVSGHTAHRMTWAAVDRGELRVVEGDARTLRLAELDDQVRALAGAWLEANP